MKMKRNKMRFVISLMILVLLSITVIGQTNRGGISGTVSDAKGGVIPGASVTIKNIGTGQEQTVITTEDGNFTLNSLEPVFYSVTVTAGNFKKTTVPSVKVDTATTQTVNVTLEAGNIGEEVTIVADELTVTTESATTSQTITERELRDLPLNNRSVLDLAMTAPNVSGDAGSEDPEVTSGQPVPGFNISVNGGRPGSTNILADGVNNTGVGIARSVVSFTPETVQEFTVQTSAYSAEFGQTGGGVINATTKSGTNRLNGTALIYHRNPKFNAQPYRIGTTPRTPNNLRYTNGSLTVGGPVFLPAFGEGGPMLYDGRNRTFFFFAYEPRWRQDFITTTTLIPTAAMMAGDFRGLVRTAGGWLPQAVATQFNQVSVGPADIYQQFTLSNGNLVPITLGAGQRYCQYGATINGTTVLTNAAGQPVCTAAYVPDNALNVIPTAFIDPIAPKILAFMPTAEGYFLDGNVVRNKVINRQVNQDETRWTFKFDHQLTSKNKINFRYTVTPAVGVRNFGSDVNGSTGVYSDAKQFLLGDDHIFSATMYNSLKLSYTRGVFSEDFAPEFSIYGGRNLATELGLPSLTPGGLPLFQISADGFSNAFADIGSSGSTNNFNVEERFSINDIFYWTRGNMTWKFGTELNQARLNVVPFFGASGGRWEFRSVNSSYDRSTNVARGGNPLASLLVGVPNAVQVRPLLVNYDYRWKGGALFVQNDWKVRPNLTLNLGLRYSLQLPRTEKNDLQGVFREDLATTQTLTTTQRNAILTGLGVSAANPNHAGIIALIPNEVRIPVFAFAGRGGRSRYLVPVDKMGFEPRFGFAWSPKFWGWAAERNAVIRGGYGLSHAPLTGNNRNPNPDFGAFQAVSTAANGSTVGGTADPTQPVNLSRNAPLNVVEDLFARLNVTSDGLITTNSIGTPGFVSPGENSGAVPYAQNWNLSLQLELLRNTIVEVAYVGNKGTHLYMPLVNVNPANVAFTELLEANNLSAETTFADPLGRRNVANAVVAISRNSVATNYFGFGNFNRFFDPAANSIRHAGYIQFRRRISQGISLNANYTFGKSIDDSSDASPDVRVLTTGSTLGHVYYGAPRSNDRSISTFDIKHSFNATFVWDIPVGRKRWLLKDAPGIVDAVLGGWTMSGVFRWQGGQPFIPFVTDTNRLNGVNRTVRLDLVPGVPLINPLYDASKCSIGAGCEPFLNPSAFMRPVKGELGNAPRTLDVRAPMQEYFDLSIQKNFYLFGESRRYLQFRMDLLNAFNHPNFRFVNTGNTPPGFGTLPNETTLSLAEYNAYLTANGRANVTATDPTFVGIVNMVNGQRTATGAIPLDFFHIRIPEGFATKTPNSFDLTTLEGYKLYRLRQTYDANFGTLFAVNNPRYIQFGIKFVF